MTISMDQAIHQFLNRGLADYASTTQANIRRDMVLWQEVMGNTSPDEITVRQLNRLLKTPMAPSTARRRLASLRMAYAWWVRHTVIQNNKLEKLLSRSSRAFPFRHTGIHRTRYLPSTDSNKIIHAAQAHLRIMEVYHYLLPAFLLSGLRINETLSLSSDSLHIGDHDAWILVEKGRRIPLSYRIPVHSFRQAMVLLLSLRQPAKSIDLFPFGRSPAERILRSIFLEADMHTTASALRWRGIMDNLDQGMSISMASLLFSLSEKNLQRQYGFYKR
jgi:integrase